VACKQAHFDGYEESAALIKREFNHELRIIPKNELRGEIGSDIYFGGMVDETSAGLNPRVTSPASRMPRNAPALACTIARASHPSS